VVEVENLKDNLVDIKNPGWGQPILDKIKELTPKPPAWMKTAVFPPPFCVPTWKRSSRKRNKIHAPLRRLRHAADGTSAVDEADPCASNPL